MARTRSTTIRAGQCVKVRPVATSPSRLERLPVELLWVIFDNVAADKDNSKPTFDAIVQTCRVMKSASDSYFLSMLRRNTKHFGSHMESALAGTILQPTEHNPNRGNLSGIIVCPSVNAVGLIRLTFLDVAKSPIRGFWERYGRYKLQLPPSPCPAQTRHMVDVTTAIDFFVDPATLDLPPSHNILYPDWSTTLQHARAWMADHLRTSQKCLADLTDDVDILRRALLHFELLRRSPPGADALRHAHLARRWRGDTDVQAAKQAYVFLLLLVEPFFLDAGCRPGHVLDRMLRRGLCWLAALLSAPAPARRQRIRRFVDDRVRDRDDALRDGRALRDRFPFVGMDDVPDGPPAYVADDGTRVFQLRRAKVTWIVGRDERRRRMREEREAEKRELMRRERQQELQSGRRMGPVERARLRKQMRRAKVAS